MRKTLELFFFIELDVYSAVCRTININKCAAAKIFITVMKSRLIRSTQKSLLLMQSGDTILNYLPFSN